jgi:hypothetical protein
MHGAIHLFDRLPQVDVPQPTAEGCPHAPVRNEPLVGLIRNPHSHGNEGTPVNPEELPGVLIASPSRRSELPEILASFAEQGVDYIAINGGDGTVRDVLTCGAGAFGESWPALIIMPSGKTNALAHDLGIAPQWTLAEAMDAARRDSAVIRRPLVVAQRDNESAQVRGFVLGAGAYTPAISLGQDAHDFGAFNAAAVGVTVVWSFLQALLAALATCGAAARGCGCAMLQEANCTMPAALRQTSDICCLPQRWRRSLLACARSWGSMRRCGWRCLITRAAASFCACPLFFAGTRARPRAGWATRPTEWKRLISISVTASSLMAKLFRRVRTAFPRVRGYASSFRDS